MTKQRIGQYSKLQREIAMLEDQIYRAESGGEYVSDSVQGSSPRIPYAKRCVTIKGYGSSKIPRLSARLSRCEAECKAIEDYIDGVEDSVMRQLLTLRYVEGLSMKDTAAYVGYSASHAKRLVSSALKDDT